MHEKKIMSYHMCSAVYYNECSVQAEEKVKEKPENYSVVTNMRMQVKDNGIFYLDGYEKLMKFYDYELKESIPVCDKPNCKHRSFKCNAYIENGLIPLSEITEENYISFSRQVRNFLYM